MGENFKFEEIKESLKKREEIQKRELEDHRLLLLKTTITVLKKNSMKIDLIFGQS